MARRKASKPKPVQYKTTSPEAVENLKDALGRLIARRVLREWRQSRPAPDTDAPTSTDAKRAD